MLKRIVNIVLALLILLSSTSFSVNMHFCHEQLIDVAVFAPARSCCSQEATDGKCCGLNEITQKNHCQDESIVLENTDDFITSIVTFNFENQFQLELPWLVLSSFDLLNTKQNTLRSIRDFKIPPPFSDVILSEIQAFLL